MVGNSEDAEKSKAIIVDQRHFKISKKKRRQYTDVLTGRFNWRL